MPLNLTPLSIVSIRMLDRTGRVVFDGRLAETALSPWCRFWRVIVNLIRSSEWVARVFHRNLYYYVSNTDLIVVVVVCVDLWTFTLQDIRI